MDERYELLVIGAGPAGMETAMTAAHAGVNVCVVDGYDEPGGQYYKQMPHIFTCDDRTGHAIDAAKTIKAFVTSDLKFYAGTLVWGIFNAGEAGWCVTVYGPGAPLRIYAKYLVLATGAYDRPVAFPGWTLPGVVTAGAIQSMIKSQRVLPGKQFLFAGSGPLQLAAAAQVVRAGGNVTAVYEGSPYLIGRGFSHLFGLWGQSKRLIEGWDYWRALSAAGVQLRFGWIVVEARGNEEVEEVVVARVDSEWKPIPGSEKVHKADTLVIGYGLVPATEMTRLLHCQHEYHPEKGGWVPLRNEEMETSVCGVYAVGDGCGIGGVDMAKLEGRMAGLSVANKLGKVNENDLPEMKSTIHKGLMREKRFARLMGDVFTPGPGLLQLAKEDTLICRCEDVTLGEIRSALAYGTQTIGDVKNLVRCGMGNCQGRICGILIPQIIANDTGKSEEEVGTFNVRPPLHPLPVGVLENFDI